MVFIPPLLQPSSTKPENFQQLCDLVEHGNYFVPSDAITSLCLTIKKLIARVDSLENLLQIRLEQKICEMEPKLTMADHS